VEQSVRGEPRGAPLLLHPSIRKARVMLSLAVLLAANLLPLLGVALWGWKLFDLIVIYWLETLVIGGLSIMQMALTAGWFALFVVPFFIVHFGGFMAGHFVFLNMMFGDRNGGSLSAIPARLHDMIVAEGLWVALIGLAVSHGLGFLFTFLLPWLRRRWQGRPLREETDAGSAGSVMFGPYKRVMIMHVSILLGAFLVSVFGNNFAFLALLVALKTVSDLYMLRRQWKGEGIALPA
jgi:hypothetical protein